MISGPVRMAPSSSATRDDDHHHALLGEHPAVAEHALADVADDAVDVEVAGRHLAGDADALVVDRELVAVGAHERALLGHAHRLGQLGVRHEVAVLAVHRHEPLRLHDREERLDLLLLGVAGGVDVLDAGVHDLGAEAHEPVDHLAHVSSRCPGSGATRGSPCRPRRW